MVDQATSIRVIKIAGEPYDRGLAYGREAKDEIHASVSARQTARRALGIGDEELRSGLASLRQRIEPFGAHLAREMEGIAEGAGLSFDDILLVNAYDDIAALHLRPIAGAQPASIGWIAIGSSTGQPAVLHGQVATDADPRVVLEIAGPDGTSTLVVATAGSLGCSGINSAGLAISAVPALPLGSGWQAGVPLSIVTRMALEQQKLLDALKVASETPITAVATLAVSHANGFGMALERYGDKYIRAYSDNDVIVHSDRFSSEVAHAKGAAVGAVVGTGEAEAVARTAIDETLASSAKTSAADLLKSVTIAGSTNRWVMNVADGVIELSATTSQSRVTQVRVEGARL